MDSMQSHPCWKICLPRNWRSSVAPDRAGNPWLRTAFFQCPGRTRGRPIGRPGKKFIKTIQLCIKGDVHVGNGLRCSQWEIGRYFPHNVGTDMSVAMFSRLQVSSYGCRCYRGQRRLFHGGQRRRRHFSDQLTPKATAPDLEHELGNLAPTYAAAGQISPYFGLKIFWKEQGTIPTTIAVLYHLTITIQSVGLTTNHLQEGLSSKTKVMLHQGFQGVAYFRQ
ncbi:hypothetical protein TRIUR3_11810 [Triticum urartu]|uniref:Uncharacterized protein n=1 Tax=Triticum urartu TaxID=4572 RepID=M7YR72_TRIUA|nr:hypothetical protein TRIUR3_11810 [Triticum urartu]